MKQSLHCRKRFPIGSFCVFAILIALAVTAFAQTNDGRAKNNPYFPSPAAKVKQAAPAPAPVPTASTSAQVSISKVVRPDKSFEIRPAAAPSAKIAAKTIDLSSASPVDIYRIDVGDIIFVNLKNAPNSSGYYTVKANGMIDFPLAGETLVVAGRTSDEVANMLAGGITLYADPQVQVKVREYRSHKITISGMVDQSGESSMQREAIPLYVICAQSGVDPKATKAVVHRSDGAQVETFSMHEATSDKILIYPGNSIEFTADAPIKAIANNGSYVVTGKVNTTGQKEFVAGITLSQAIIVSGGAKGNPKKASISRKGDDGTPNISEHDLRAIKDGKAPDPVLSPGDVIEIGN